MEKRRTGLVIDDQDEVLQSVALMLEAQGYEVTATKKIDEALRALAQAPMELVLCDVNLGQAQNGVEVAQQILRTNPSQPLVLMSGFGRPLSEAVLDFVFLNKPFEVAELRAAIEQAMRLAALSQTTRRAT